MKKLKLYWSPRFPDYIYGRFPHGIFCYNPDGWWVYTTWKANKMQEHGFEYVGSI